MFKLFISKLKESVLSVSPIVFFVFILNIAQITKLTKIELVCFLIASVLIVLGIALFNLGADISMTPMGKEVGRSMSKSKKIGPLLFICFAIGVLVTVAEPDLSVLSNQLSNMINPTVLIIFVGCGVGLFLMIAIIKIITKKQLSLLLMFFYLLLFAIAILIATSKDLGFLPVAFDSGGVTTGPITVPFIMALGIGVANSLGGKNAKENSFGLIALCSIGAVVAVLVLGLLSDGQIAYEMSSYDLPQNVVLGFLNNVLVSLKEVGLALSLICIFFLLYNFVFIKLSKRELYRLGIGTLITYLGLVIFLASANTVYISIGFKIGNTIANLNEYLLIPVGLIIGAIVVLAEPAIHILTHQVEDTTNKMISKKAMLIGLTVGVGASIALSMLRIILNFNIMYYLVPGYILSLGISLFVPSVYTAVAFDAGGVASGPLTSTFILPLAIGACFAIGGQSFILSNAFGVVAMVAMTPLITIQLLGFGAIVKNRIRKRIAMNRILENDDRQVIEFEEE